MKYIHKITCPEGKSFIGYRSEKITQYTIKKFINTNNGCRLLMQAVERFGLNNMVISLLETCSDSEVMSRKDYYINKYDTLHPNGYNLDDGYLKKHKETSKQHRLTRMGDDINNYKSDIINIINNSNGLNNSKIADIINDKYGLNYRPRSLFAIFNSWRDEGEFINSRARIKLPNSTDLIHEHKDVILGMLRAGDSTDVIYRKLVDDLNLSICRKHLNIYTQSLREEYYIKSRRGSVGFDIEPYFKEIKNLRENENYTWKDIGVHMQDKYNLTLNSNTYRNIYVKYEESK